MTDRITPSAERLTEWREWLATANRRDPEQEVKLLNYRDFSALLEAALANAAVATAKEGATPRTDAVYHAAALTDETIHGDFRAMLALAADLERELAEAHAAGEFGLKMHAQDLDRLEQELQAARSATTPSKALTTIPLIRRIQQQRDEVADVLRDIVSRALLPYSSEVRAKAVLAKIPTYEQQLRNIAEGIGMSYEELMGAIENVAVGSNGKEGAA